MRKTKLFLDRILLLALFSISVFANGDEAEVTSCEKFLRSVSAENVIVVTPRVLSKATTYPAKDVVQKFNPATDFIVGLTEQRHGYLIVPGLPRFDAGFFTRGEIRTPKGEPFVNRGLFFHFSADEAMAQTVLEQIEIVRKERQISCIQAIGKILGNAGIGEFTDSMITPKDLITSVEALGRRTEVQPYLFGSEAQSYDQFVSQSSVVRGGWWMTYWSTFWGTSKRRRATTTGGAGALAEAQTGSLGISDASAAESPASRSPASESPASESPASESPASESPASDSDSPTCDCC